MHELHEVHQSPWLQDVLMDLIVERMSYLLERLSVRTAARFGSADNGGRGG